VERTGREITRAFGAEKIYNALSDKHRKQWDSRITSQVHCLIIVPLSFYAVINFKGDIYDVFALNEAAELPLTITLGYFLNDLLESLQHPKMWGVGMFVHAVACLIAYGFVLTHGFIMYFGTVFLMWEISTIFLNFRGFLYAAGKESSVLYKVNGILLVLSFFLVRICFGYTQSYHVWVALGRGTHAPLYLRGYFYFSNLVMNILNTYWMILIAKGAISGFSKKTAADNKDSKAAKPVKPARTPKAE